MGRIVRQAEELVEDTWERTRDAARALDVRVEHLARARVHLLFDVCDAEEALDMALALRATGDHEQAADVVRAALDQVAGLGGVPQPEQRDAEGRVLASNRPA